MINYLRHYPLLIEVFGHYQQFPENPSNNLRRKSDFTVSPHLQKRPSPGTVKTKLYNIIISFNCSSFIKDSTIWHIRVRADSLSTSIRQCNATWKCCCTSQWQCSTCITGNSRHCNALLYANWVVTKWLVEWLIVCIRSMHSFAEVDVIFHLEILELTPTGEWVDLLSILFLVIIIVIHETNNYCLLPVPVDHTSDGAFFLCLKGYREGLKWVYCMKQDLNSTGAKSMRLQ